MLGLHPSYLSLKKKTSLQSCRINMFKKIMTKYQILGGAGHLFGEGGAPPLDSGRENADFCDHCVVF